jgi:hypothetical protein
VRTRENSLVAGVSVSVSATPQYGGSSRYLTRRDISEVELPNFSR